MSRGIAILMLTMTALFWGLAFVAQKTAMESMGPLTFIGVRFIIGGLLVLPLALNDSGGLDELHRAALAAQGVSRAYARVASGCATPCPV